MYPEKLKAHLDSGFKPIYLLHGDEPLGMMEAADLIRRSAAEQGYSEREVVIANEDADWSTLKNTLDSMSLFAEQRIIDLRMLSGKPGRVGAAMLKDIALTPPTQELLLISSGRLDRAQLNSAWFKAIDKVGVTVTFWPLKLSELPRWIETRMKACGLSSTKEARLLIAERVEGNMLAAQQEIERLSLLFPDQEIDAKCVLAAVANSARYSINDVVDAVMGGDPARAVRVVDGLRDEGVTPILVLWALTQEIRSGTHVAQALAVGKAPQSAMKSAGIWGNREGPLKLALARHTERSWLSLLSLSCEAERVLKGQGDGDIWQLLKDMSVRLGTDGRDIVAPV